MSDVIDLLFFMKIIFDISGSKSLEYRKLGRRGRKK